MARARVTLRTEALELSRTTQPDGTFVFEGVTGSSGELIVNASGFATSSTAWNPGENQVAIVLTAAAVQQSLDVTATRTSILPSGVDDIESQPDVALIASSQLQQWAR